MILNCIIVDDETLSHKLLSDYISKVPQLNLVQEFYSAVDAINYLNDQNGSVDIIFLDINMPELTGVEMLKVFPLRANVIFTTAYSDYAIEAFDLGVLDYLLKPIRFERFLKAVNRIINMISAARNSVRAEKTTDKYIIIKHNKENVTLQTDQILYIQGFENYLKIYTPGKVYLTNGPLKEIESILGASFIRIHRSYLVSKARITKVKVESIMLGEIELPIGSSYQQLLKFSLNKN